MYWKDNYAPRALDEVQTVYGSDPNDWQFAPLDLKQFTRARVVLATCDVNHTHAIYEVAVEMPTPTKVIGGFTYYFQRNEAFGDLLSSIYLRDEGDEAPSSVKLSQDYEAVLTAAKEAAQEFLDADATADHVAKVAADVRYRDARVAMVNIEGAAKLAMVSDKAQAEIDRAAVLADLPPAFVKQDVKSGVISKIMGLFK